GSAEERAGLPGEDPGAGGRAHRHHLHGTGSQRNHHPAPSVRLNRKGPPQGGPFILRPGKRRPSGAAGNVDLSETLGSATRCGSDACAKTKKASLSLAFVGVWCRGEDLNLHRVSPTST